MNLKSTGIVTLHAYLPPQHAVKAMSAPCFLVKAVANLELFNSMSKNKEIILSKINNYYDDYSNLTALNQSLPVLRRFFTYSTMN